MFSLNGAAPHVSCEVFPPMDLSDGEYEIGLIDLSTYYTIPNIERGVNDMFHYGVDKEIVIDEGSYEIENIEEYIKSHIDGSVTFSLKANNNTLKSEVSCSEAIHFEKPNSVASVLGFTAKELEPHKTHMSDLPVSIMAVNTIRVECNIARGSFQNGMEGHVLHEFYPDVAPGYKIVEKPSTVIYLPVNVRRVNNIEVSLRDQNGDLINFRNEPVSLRLHIRKRQWV
ncbi:uncharacterized protein LOC124371209 [Homalodisca vitripennis]|uniref:uncharacterized protein LOC124371209 n=1 Tax=Homalodisca vitripennis TaxID=197043 RepID=UPI001EEAEDA4|nr:uncharacterized protein LOC124371209 [Homalodisca vitripennis]